MSFVKLIYALSPALFALLRQLPVFSALRYPERFLWIAILFIIILAVWLGVVLIWGYQPLVLGMTYDEAVMGIGLV